MDPWQSVQNLTWMFDEDSLNLHSIARQSAVIAGSTFILSILSFSVQLIINT